MGKKVAVIKDKNSNDCTIIGSNNSKGSMTPISKLLEKLGKGNIKKPPIKPMKIEI
tara:strand:+ start:712 stop:879 length:168 start_codon:yes stop_codon:yes gene_type:complete